MQLLQELLEIKQNTELEQLLEDLGNLKDLKLGPLVNAFKQTYNINSHRTGGDRPQTHEVGAKFNHWSGIGKDSEIIDVPQTITKWAHVRKAYNMHPDAVAMAFHLDEKPVALLVATTKDTASAGSAVGLAWDLTKSGLSEAEQAEILGMLNDGSVEHGHRDAASTKTKGKSTHEVAKGAYVDSWDKKSALSKEGKVPKTYKEIVFKDYEDWSDITRAGGAKLEKGEVEVIAKKGEVVVGKWNKKDSKGYLVVDREPFNDKIDRVYDKPKQFVGLTQTTKQVSRFLEALARFGQLSAKIVLADKVKNAKRGERSANRPIDPKEMKLFKDDLVVRLQKFKNSKVETVDDIKTFVAKVMAGGLSKLNFAGRTYSAVPATKTTYVDKKQSYVTDDTLKKLLTGKPVSVKFESDRVTDSYNDLNLEIKFANGSIVPVSARYHDGKKYVEEKF